MTRLTVWYDARCGLCRALRDWIRHQPQLVAVECRPRRDATDDLVVQADSGEVWSGDSAWLIVLWALAGYRQWACRLSDPALLPLARRMFATLSAHRGSVSCSLGLTGE
jgi:predicted DCC family thiol-disulfide oxidoreductase YuxK